MARSADLQRNTTQHKPKNVESKRSDKAIHQAMLDCIKYLKLRLSSNLKGYELNFDTKLSYDQLIAMIRESGQRLEFDQTFLSRTIKPDGGVIWLRKSDDEDYRRLVLVSEIKKQGTNKERMQQGQTKQAQGNAIERLGKNLTGMLVATVNLSFVAIQNCTVLACR